MISERYHALVRVGSALDTALQYIHSAREGLVGQRLEEDQDMLVQAAKLLREVYEDVRDSACHEGG